MIAKVISETNGEAVDPGDFKEPWSEACEGCGADAESGMDIDQFVTAFADVLWSGPKPVDTSALEAFTEAVKCCRSQD